MSKDGSNNLDCIVDNVSVKEIAFDWNRTTKVKNASGSYTRDIKEEDITLIKKYPLNAPKMELINTTKPKGSVIKTSCTTPINTTYNYSSCFLDGFGDEVRYNEFINVYLTKDVDLKDSVSTVGDGHGAWMQLDIGGVFDNLDSSTLGSTVPYPLYIDDNWNSISTGINQKFGTPQYVSNSFTTKADYHKRAWQTWCSISEKYPSHMYCVTSAGEYSGFSSGLISQDKLGERLWIRPINAAKMQNAAIVTSSSSYRNAWKKGDRISIGYWTYNNNYTFWTYKDGDGNILVKPPGTSTIPKTFADGKILLDEAGGFNVGSPTVLNPGDHYTASPGKFATGWSGDGNKYIGAAHTTTGATGTKIYDPSNTSGLPLETMGSATDGYQYIHGFGVGIVQDYTYNIRCRVTITANPAANSNPAVGVSILSVSNDEIISNGAHLPDAASVGTHWINKHFKAKSTGSLAFFKRNGVECIIDSIQLSSVYANPVRIQPLIFSPKPDYVEGDLVKLTNTNKAPNGSDVEITMKLGAEVASGSHTFQRWSSKNTTPNHSGSEFVNDAGTGMEAPETWADGHELPAGGMIEGNDMITDSDFKLTTTAYINAVIALGALDSFDSGGDLNDDNADPANNNVADWTTSLEVIGNGDFATVDPNDALKPKYWKGSYGGFNTINEGSSTDKWTWDSTIGEISKSTSSSSYTNFNQFGKDNNRLFLENGGIYKYSYGLSNLSVTGLGGVYFRMWNENGWAKISADTTSATHTGSITFDPNTPSAGVTGDWSTQSSWKTSFSTNDVDRNAFGFVAQDNGGTFTVTTAEIDNVSLLANNNINRCEWGTQTSGGGCDVVVGTCTQIVAYPARADGVRSAGTGTFVLTDGEYYRMQYIVESTNYVDQTSSVGCTIKLFNHDAWNQIYASSSNEGHIHLDASNGTHYVSWKQKGTKNQLEIAFGPGFAGKLKEVEVYPLTVTKIDYGASGSNDTRKIFKSEITKISNNLLQLSPEQHKYWTCELVDIEPIFQRVFPIQIP